MFSTEQIRTLNDARTILTAAKKPHTWEGGVVKATCEHASDAIFQALNHTRAYLGQPIHDDLMHNREDPDRTRSLGRADSITVESDEDGFELHISTDVGAYVVNVHGISAELLAAVEKEIGGYWAEGRAAAAQHQRDLDLEVDADAYEPSDPKHPGWSTRVADSYDIQRGDR